jgi:hypothetical protein
MDPIKLDGFALALEPDDILRGQGGDPVRIRQARPAIYEAARIALEAEQSFLHPIAILRHSRVLESRHQRIVLEAAGDLNGAWIVRQLAGAERVSAVVCTIGAELEEHSRQVMDKDPVLGLAIDGLGNAAIEQLAQIVCQRIASDAAAEGWTTTAPLSPGHPDWPVEIGQAQVFRLVPADLAGIRLTSGGMMVPQKSITFIVGSGKVVSQAGLCEVCSLGETCRYRHA